MKLIVILFFLEFFLQTNGLSQSRQVDATLALGNGQGSLSFFVGKDWNFGKKKKLGIGTGIRLTSYVGHHQYYETAPAILTSGKTGPGVIFVDNITANIDSLKFSSSQVNSMNVFINLNYQVTPRILIGFNIDAIGFSFGNNQSGNYIHNGKITTTMARPTVFNILLISDNDRGTLNSEFYGKYLFAQKWGMKVAGQFLFTEYTTSNNIQLTPAPNDRFRNKSLMLALGVFRKF